MKARLNLFEGLAPLTDLNTYCTTMEAYQSALNQLLETQLSVLSELTETLKKHMAKENCVIFIQIE